MNKISNEVKIGIIVLAATIVAYLGFRIMKDEPFFSNTKVLYTKFETVEGLIRGSSVYLNGFKVGAVKDMEYLVEEDSALITLNITEPIRLPKGSKAQLATPDFLGSASIRLIHSDNTEFLEWGSKLEGVQKEGLLDSVTEKGTSLADSVSTTLTLTNEMLRKVVELQEGNSSEISETISSFQKTSKTIQQIIEQRQGEIDSMIVDAHVTMQNIRTLSDSSGQDTQSLIANLEEFSQELEGISKGLKESSESISSILSKIDTGEGTVGLMINDPSLYQNMDSLTVNLNELIKGIQEDPRRYLKHMRLVEIF